MCGVNIAFTYNCAPTFVVEAHESAVAPPTVTPCDRPECRVHPFDSGHAANFTLFLLKLPVLRVSELFDALG